MRGYHRATIRARAPLRLGLAGGGTDLSAYCDAFGGAVLNATIDRFAYASISPRDDGQIVFQARDRRYSQSLAAAAELPEATLPLHRGVYERVVRDFNDGIPFAATITTTVDAEPDSGLGSSSALTVALLAVAQASLGVPWHPHDAAALACDIERNDLALPGGQQDQYSAAFGGINFIEFRGGGDVVVNQLRIPDDIRNELEASLAVCFAGGRQGATAIIQQQMAALAERDPATIAAFDRLKESAPAMKDAMLRGDIRQMARILDDAWASKQLTAAGVSTGHIDRLRDVAFAHGALAGKVSGAGGGGFLMFIAPPEDRLEMITALNAAGGVCTPVKFSERGCETWRVRL